MAGVIGSYPEGLDYTPKGTRVFHVFKDCIYREVDENGKATGIPRQLLDVLTLAHDDWVVYVALTYHPFYVTCLLKEKGRLVYVEVE